MAADKKKANESPTDWVVMHHPVTGGQGTVQRQSLPTWKELGWVAGPVPEQKAGTQPATEQEAGK